MDHIEELARAFTRFPGIDPRQARRFVYSLLMTPARERQELAHLITNLAEHVHQCPLCQRYYNGTRAVLCEYCTDTHRDSSQLLLVEKDQDLAAVERAGTYTGRYFVLGGVLTLTGKGRIREKELLALIDRRLAEGLTEVVLALGATSEGEHTTDYIRTLLMPYRDRIKLSMLGRGLATGSELEYSDAETLRAALASRREA
jgi:recombination protein RecR